MGHRFPPETRGQALVCPRLSRAKLDVGRSCPARCVASRLVFGAVGRANCLQVRRASLNGPRIRARPPETAPVGCWPPVSQATCAIGCFSRNRRIIPKSVDWFHLIHWVFVLLSGSKSASTKVNGKGTSKIGLGSASVATMSKGAISSFKHPSFGQPSQFVDSVRTPPSLFCCRSRA